ncbi:seipin-like isoform X2 [Echeneis naucrates]|uniref:seipin-like isoform X2 n=1 Tax=Echeneis naucrates TaxID=173247 RepID=UPI001113F6BC|nr:seipin isoform X2 [Echeneis naucrates]
MAQESPVASQADRELSVLIGRTCLTLRELIVTMMSNARKRVLQGCVALSVILLLLWLATFLYGSFYYAYMPRAAFSTPVHYYYRTDCESPSSFLCSYPVANVSLMRNKKHVLTFGQAYQISLQLEMPESPTNQELGMFMIKTTCFSRDGGRIVSSARSSMLRYRSDLLRTLGTLLFFPAFVSGAIEQKQILEVDLFPDYTDDPYSPSVTAVIEILSNKVQIYSSQLFVHAHFTGIRYLLFYFPVSSALVGVSSNFIFLSVVFVLSYMRVGWKPDELRADGPVSARERNANNTDQEDEKDISAAETNNLTGTAELLGPLQITPTNLSWERPHLHFGNGTELQSRYTLGHVEMNESEAP